jgi:hypothetical protein
MRHGSDRVKKREEDQGQQEKDARHAAASYGAYSAFESDVVLETCITAKLLPNGRSGAHPMPRAGRRLIT